MKKIIKIIFLTLLSIIIFLILIDTFAMTVTVRKVTKDIKTVEGSKESLDSDTSEIYCKYIPDGELGDWVVIGKDGVLFNHDNKKRDEIIVIGNVPKEINHNILRNIFVFEGKYLGVKNRKGCKHDLKTFEAENWFIKYPIERISVEKYYPKNGLSLLDILDAEVMPVHEIVEDEN
ncbi:hypothetical protein NE172_14050 [Clostridium botulinum]|uniref:Uncharacterized protein n=1 Tax=Clostridium botulinum TaxID=1491 RepID=A0A6B4JLN3_CLOBO|nr:hypothetical protein [Clostridium botulinum]EES51023.1 hypothetical protein CLO_2138 [Clostridium botulinum E1 str. 'BoNT E Beluga']MBY6761151.1 hypothetical protein [Clostridium botulinum]MBY6921371.1 hypothetical protein [Clostridium botulinum]MCR1132061.1 hypothetical protein [Clostridium botulinum]NFJ57830.1 hypothetical protein [Clostridium botulinum]